ncbi:PTS system, cellobiose-specific IIA component [Clostridium cavendishii DSM 21758]|uniref:PTS system, cellobiose-specific IIA component n=1 Tax=Clostridium cavendishii DSM 21758 TaxID=1121302 RepID=A0A1M6UP82_9CLOT|nr:PTS lactose/cellobiose transporter subunit IIA [Clostridium cavendishii]SHK70986.1 PTS system, cellobiose-specific IIA component [Clostridium cavendishii DSM 21758]
MEQEIFEIIAHAGDSRGYTFEALREARKNNFKEAEGLLVKAKEELTLAHNTQTKLIQAEINGEDIKISLLMVHAQDQLMDAISENTLVEEMIEMYRIIHSK